MTERVVTCSVTGGLKAGVGGIKPHIGAELIDGGFLALREVVI